MICHIQKRDNMTNSAWRGCSQTFDRENTTPFKKNMLLEVYMNNFSNSFMLINVRTQSITHVEAKTYSAGAFNSFMKGLAKFSMPGNFTNPSSKMTQAMIYEAEEFS